MFSGLVLLKCEIPIEQLCFLMSAANYVMIYKFTPAVKVAEAKPECKVVDNTEEWLTKHRQIE